jgi:hypothetical protein
MDNVTLVFYVLFLVALVQIDRRLYDIVKTLKRLIPQS